MSAIVRSSEASGGFKQANGETALYSFPHDAEAASTKGMSAACALAETGQRQANSTCANGHTTLNTASNEHVPEKCNKRGENAEGKGKVDEAWRKPAKRALATCFCKQKKAKEKITMITSMMTGAVL